MRKIYIKDQFTLIDNEDYDIVNQYRWYISTNGYVVSFSHASKKTTYLHRLILKTPKGAYTDHISGNTLDNRKENLRICTQSQNMMNSSIHKNTTSGYKGVYFRKDKWRKKKWMAYLNKDLKRIHIGNFITKEEAAKAYNQAALKYHGKYAKLNVI